MSDKKTYSGSCHCGNVRFDVSAEIREIVGCNCSICGKRGWLLVFVPREDFTLRSGEGTLTDYQFGNRHLHHLFCSTCGIGAFSRGTSKQGHEMIAVNVRCLEGIDPEHFSVKRFDGKSL